MKRLVPTLLACLLATVLPAAEIGSEVPDIPETPAADEQVTEAQNTVEEAAGESTVETSDETTATSEQIQQTVIEAETEVQETVDTQRTVDVTRTITTTVTRVVSVQQPLPGPSAGDFLSNVALTIDGTTARVETLKYDASGNSHGLALSLTATAADLVDLGLTVSMDNFNIDEPNTTIQNDTSGINLFAMAPVNEYWSLGVFLDASLSDARSSIYFANGNFRVRSNKEEDSYGAGILSNVGYPTPLGNVGWTSVYASLGRDDFLDIASSVDSIWLNSVDLYRPLNDRFNADVYLTHNWLVCGGHQGREHSYFIGGASIGVEIVEDLHFDLGYERLFDYTDYREGRITGSLNYSF